MPLLLNHPSLLFGVWKIEEPVDELLACLDQRERYLPFLETCKAHSRQQEWLAVRVLLKLLLGREELIAYRPDGSPFLPDNPNLSLSISHTRGYAAVYCVPNGSAGIDIEYRSERVLKIKDRFLSEEELGRMARDCFIEQLLIGWCAKETLFKLIRQEDVDFREHLHIRPFLYAEEGGVDVWETKTDQKQAFRLSFLVTPEFVLTYNR